MLFLSFLKMPNFFFYWRKKKKRKKHFEKTLYSSEAKWAGQEESAVWQVNQLRAEFWHRSYFLLSAYTEKKTQTQRASASDHLLVTYECCILAFIEQIFEEFRSWAGIVMQASIKIRLSAILGLLSGDSEVTQLPLQECSSKVLTTGQEKEQPGQRETCTQGSRLKEIV